MEQCELATFVAGIGDGRDHRDIGNAPGERSLAALVRSASVDPERSVREFRAEAMSAAEASATMDAFSGRQLRARANRYARAAAIVEARCLACGSRCVSVPFSFGPPIRERRFAPERRVAGWRGWSRRMDDRLANRVIGAA